MLNALSSGQYIAGRSLLHRSDPRTKLALTLVFTLIVFTVRSPVTLVLLLLLSFGAAQHVGRPFKNSLRGLKPIVNLAAFTAVAQIFFSGGPALAESGILSHFSRDGAEHSLMMILRLTVLVNGTSLLTATTTPLTMTDGLQWLMNPLRRVGLQVSEIALMMSLTLRFMPVIAEEARGLAAEQSTRFPQLAGGNLLQRGRCYLPLVMPLFAGVCRRGDALATAMDARCYGACPQRSHMHPLRFTTADLLCGGVVLFILLFLVYIENFWIAGG